MAEYIEREEVKRQLRIWIQEAEEDMAHDVADCFRDCIDLLDDVPAADVVEVRHGRWVSLTPPLLLEEFREMEADIFFMCSECKDECKLVEQDDYYNYCPRCGALMDKEE